MEFDGAEAISSHVLQHHALIAFRIPPRQFTILAAFLISSEASGLKTISLATGTKCLPVSRLPEQGDALHDSHAEILARRAAVRWLYDEISRPQSPWIRKGDNGLYELNQGVRVHLYISTPPCMVHLLGLNFLSCSSLSCLRRRRVDALFGLFPG